MVFALHTEKKAKLWSDYKSTIDSPGWLALKGEPWGAYHVNTIAAQQVARQHVARQSRCLSPPA